MKHTITQELLQSYLPQLIQCPLFESIESDVLMSFLLNGNIIIESYQKGAFVAIAGDPMQGIGVMLSGHAHLTRENMLGQRSIMTDLNPSSMFGEALLFTRQPLWPATIQTTKASTFLFIPLPTFTVAFPNCQNCQIQILTNLMKDMSEKAILLTKKVHYLTLKGMREKIYAYFIDIYNRQKTNPITLPHNRQEMADVLNVSRTALSRELGRLKDEEIIDFKGRKVELIDLQTIRDYAF